MTENTNPLSVSQMVRLTGENSNTFMKQVADHIDSLEQSIVELQQRIAMLEGTTNATE